MKENVDIKTAAFDDNSLEKLKHLNILIAEDDESALFYLNELLKRKCNRISTARSGLEAVDTIKKSKDIHLILMDIKMPEMDGFEATRAIKKINPEIKIIGQTAFALIGDKRKVLSAGCDDYITKPINKNLLFRMICKHF